MSDRNQFRLFVLCALLCFAYPLYRVIQFEFPANPPNAYLFELGGRDPVDQLRGHYLRLNFTQDTIELEDVTITTAEYHPEYGQANDRYGYVRLAADPQTGLAKLAWTGKRPAEGDYLRLDYLSADYQFNSEKARELKDKGKLEPYHPRVRIVLPMTRFYVNEHDAARLDAAMDKLSSHPGAIRLRLLSYPDGHYMLDDLLLEGKPYREYLRQTRQ